LIRTSAPLKLVIAGEWAVLEPNSCAIVAAINNRLFCEIESNPKNEIEISLLDFNIKEVSAIYKDNELVFTQPLDKKTENYIRLTKFVIESALFLFNYFKPFKIRTWCEKPTCFSSCSETKFGLGSSAAAIVAILAALHVFYNIPLNKKREMERLFKFCLLSHYILQNMRGSGIDIAAAFYGGIIHYTRFDPVWVSQKIQNNFPLDIFIEYKWPNLEINHLPPIPDMKLLLGWTQKPASTSHLISQMETFKIRNAPIYHELISQITKLVKDLTKAWRKKNKSRILADIKINEMYLRRLSEISGIPIEIPELRLLCEIADELGGAGKLSGAGGGDCGIAICFDEEISTKILEEWEKYNIIGTKMEIDLNYLKIKKSKF